MGKGSSSNSSKATAKPAAAAAAKPMMTQSPFMPGDDQLLAQQLSAGGYGSMPDIMAMLSQTFTPMQVADTRPPAPVTPAPGTPTPTPTPSVPSPTPAQPTTLRDRFRMRSGLGNN